MSKKANKKSKRAKFKKAKKPVSEVIVSLIAPKRFTEPDIDEEDDDEDEGYIPPLTKQDRVKYEEIYREIHSFEDPIKDYKWQRYQLSQHNPDLIDLGVLDNLIDPRIVDRDDEYIWEEGDVYIQNYDYIDRRWEKVYLKTVELYKSYNREKVPNTSRHSKNYCEVHRIKPKCIGGEDTPDNRVIVTLDEHRVLYALLVLTYPFNTSIYYAFQLMTMRREDVGFDKLYFDDEYFDRVMEMDRYILGKRDKADIEYYLLARNRIRKED